ncbi:MAG: adenine phosphoribosyltransferase [Terriglobales bacterium]
MATAPRNACEDLKNYVREVPDFPKPGILFYDITTLLKEAAPFARLIDTLAGHYQDQKIALVAGIEARGFIFGPALAYQLGAGFVPIRKPRKLPAPVAAVDYSLEYGTDRIEVHRDAVSAGQRVLIVDDLIATGGTAVASAQLIEQLDGVVAGLAFIVELTFLHGRDKLARYDVFSLLRYDR